jgi:hypothetical protein
MSPFDAPGFRRACRSINAVVYLLLAVPLAISCASSSVSPAATDAATDDVASGGAAGAVGTDAALDRYYPRFMSACKVALDDAHNPCAADISQMSALANQEGFSDGYLCASYSTRYWSYDSQTMKTRSCLYDGRGLVAWELVSPTPDFCGGHAFAIFADLDPKGQQMGCLTVDSVWYGWDTYGDGGQ